MMMMMMNYMILKDFDRFWSGSTALPGSGPTQQDSGKICLYTARLFTTRTNPDGATICRSRPHFVRASLRSDDHRGDILAAARVYVMRHVGRRCARAARHTVTSLINSYCHVIGEIGLSSSERLLSTSSSWERLAPHQPYWPSIVPINPQKIWLPNDAEKKTPNTPGIYVNKKLKYRRDSARRRSLRRSRSYKVIDVDTKRKPICDFLLTYPISHRFQDIAQYWSNYRFYRGATASI